MQGQDAPIDAQPLTLRRSNGIKTNYHQLIPYPSRDMTDSKGKQSIYQSVKNILAPVFDFLESKVSFHFGGLICEGQFGVIDSRATS